MNFKSALLPSIVAIAMALPVAAHATSSACATSGNLVQNCGFGTGDFTNWTLSGNDVPSGAGNLYGVDQGTDPDGTGPHSGSTQAYFGDSRTNPISLTQTIATVAGKSYTISFYVAQDTAIVSPYSDLLDASFGNGVLNMTGVGVEGYTQYSFTGTASSSSSTLDLTFGNDQGYFLLDDVSVKANATVPEPPTPVLFGTAALLLLGLRLRARRV